MSTNNNNNNNHIANLSFIIASSFVSGAITACVFIVPYLIHSSTKTKTKTKSSNNNNNNNNNNDNDRTNAGATMIGNDLSLFYSSNITELTTITSDQRFLPKELYSAMVLDAVICCVDILAVRIHPITQQKQCLLVERGSEPVKGVWWLPGGRLLKGETFFAAAKRKAQEETGLINVTPIQVLGVWNTFFPTSNWDTLQKHGTQTVNPIVLVELNSVNPMEEVNVTLDSTSENYRWISLDPLAATKAGEDKYVLQALLRLQAWDPTYI